MQKLVEKIDSFKLLKNKLFLLICFFVLMLPQSIESTMTDFTLITYMRFIVFVFILLKSISYIYRHRKISSFIIALGIYTSIKGIISFYYQRDLALVIFNVLELTSCAFVVLADIEIKENTYTFFEALTIYCEIIVYADFVLTIVFGSKDNYNAPFFLIGDNNIIAYFLLSIATSFVNNELNNKKYNLRFLILTISLLVIVFVNKNATSIVAIMSLVAAIIAFSFDKKHKLINTVSLTFANIVAFIGVVFFKAQYLFKDLINMLGKDVTLSWREQVWDSFIQKIKLKPIIGYGSCIESIPVYYNDVEILFYSHNLMLRELFRGGIIQLLSYFYIVFLVCFELFKRKDTKIASILSCILFSLGISLITEVYFSTLTYLIYIICYNVSSINYKLPSNN